MQAFTTENIQPTFTSEITELSTPCPTCLPSTSCPTELPETPSTSSPTTHISESPSTSQEDSCEREVSHAAELHSESEMEVEEVSERPLKTKLATTISKALGSTYMSDCQSDLAKLDHLRTKIKHGKVSAKYLNTYKKLISLFKVKLNQNRQHLKTVIKSHERKVFSSQNRLPDKATDREYSTLLQQHYYTSKLLVSPDFNNA